MDYGLKDKRKLKYALSWILITSVIAIMYYRDYSHLQKEVLNFALHESIATFDKDIAYRKWASKHGGVYVLLDSLTPPNPYLSHIPEREITTTTGKKLTLINPAYMTRQVHELTNELYGIKGHITSLNPIRPQNIADEWESNALKKFELGIPQVNELVTIGNRKYYRFMRPLIAEKNCLKCHEQQGYKEGEIRGGLSVTLPWEPFEKIINNQNESHIIIYSILLLSIYSALIGVYFINKKNHIKQKNYEDLLLMTQNSINNARDSIFWLNRYGDIVFVNRMAYEKLGYTENELKNMKVFDIDNSFDKDQIQVMLNNMGNPETSPLETTHITKDGRHIPVEIRSSTVPYQNDIYICSIARDISERKSSELSLKRTYDRVIETLESMSDAFVSLDTNWCYTYMNRKAGIIFGRDPKEIIGKHIWTEFPEGIGQPFHLAYEKAMETQQPVTLMEYYPPYEKWFENKIYPTTNGLSIFFNDITEKKKTQDRIVQSEKNLQSLFDAISESVCLFNKDGIIITANTTFAVRLGYEVEQLIGKSVYSFIPPDVGLERKKIIEKVLLNGESIKFEDIRNGLWMSHSLWPVFDENGNVDRIVTYATDITLQKANEKLLLQQNIELESRYKEYHKLNEELVKTNLELVEARSKAEESDKLKTAFLQNISHEIRTPLNGIVGFSKFIIDPNITYDEKIEYSDVIQKSSKRLIDIVNNILDISRIETKQIELNIADCVVENLMNDLYQFFVKYCDESKINLNYFQLNKKNENIIIKTDYNKLTQILSNLIENAVKFNKPGGFIEYGYEVSNNRIKFFVKDNGIGIKDTQVNTIFERFNQADSSLTRGFEGAGLGLSICKGLVEILGGRIWVDSQYGIGSTFYFELSL